MPPIYVKNSGTIKQVAEVHVKDSGSWKQAVEVWNYKDGAWTKTHAVGDGIRIGSGGYNSLTGITYTTTLTTAATLAQRAGTNPDTVTVPSNATYVDFFMCGGGGAGGSAPQSASSNWIGSGGAGAPIIYGRLPIDPNDRPTHLRCYVGGGGTGRDTDGQGYLGRESVVRAYTSGETETRVMVAPGAMGGRPGDGTHKRIMYQPEIFELLVPVSTPSSSSTNAVYWNAVLPDSVAGSSAELGQTSVTTVEGARFNSSQTDHTAKQIWIPGPNFGLRTREDNLDGNLYLTQYMTGSISTQGDKKCAEEEADSVPSNTQRNGYLRNFVWTQDTGWKFRYYYNSAFTTGYDLPLDPGDGTAAFEDTSTTSPYAGFEFSIILPAPPERATGYAGTFRGETNSVGVPQNETFTRTTGALGTGTSLTGWSGTAPERTGGSNGSNYGTGGAGSGAYSASGNLGTSGIIQLKFGS